MRIYIYIYIHVYTYRKTKLAADPDSHMLVSTLFVTAASTEALNGTAYIL